jgi:hypothetical protein
MSFDDFMTGLENMPADKVSLVMSDTAFLIGDLCEQFLEGLDALGLQRPNDPAHIERMLYDCIVKNNARAFREMERMGRKRRRKPREAARAMILPFKPGNVS